MTVDLVITSHLSALEEEVFSWAPDVAGVASLQLQWRSKDWYVVVYEDGQPVSRAAGLLQPLTINTRELLIGGIGGVRTIPAKQGQGFASLAIKRALAHLRETFQIDFGMLFCLPRLIPFYQQRGWDLLPDPVFITQPEEMIIAPCAVMVVPAGQQIWPAGLVTLPSYPW